MPHARRSLCLVLAAAALAAAAASAPAQEPRAELVVQNGHVSWTEALATCAAGEWLATGSRLDGSVLLWRAGGGISRRFEVQSDPHGLRLALSPDGGLLAAAAAGRAGR